VHHSILKVQSTATPEKCETIAVIGNGIIGHGVAQVFAMAGKEVLLIGRQTESLARAIENIRKGLAQFQSHGLITEEATANTVNRIRTSTHLGDAAAAQFVIEAVTENLALKHDIFEQLDSICEAPIVLGSSSGQPASVLVARVKHRERVIATHFWYPPQLIPLVEVCAGPETSMDVAPWVCEQLRNVGKEPVVIDKEIRGFIGNRLQFAMLREAWSLWARRVASAEAIDAVVRNSFGRRLAITGPIESADVAGLDTMYAFARSLLPDLDTSIEPPAAVADLVRDGHRGLPSGRGIYDWTKRDGEALLKSRMDELFRWLKLSAAARHSAD
jgi:3-hydroxybutyryl-CoA dehydrogenase